MPARRSLDIQGTPGCRIATTGNSEKLRSVPEVLGFHEVLNELAVTSGLQGLGLGFSCFGTWKGKKAAVDFIPCQRSRAELERLVELQSSPRSYAWCCVPEVTLRSLTVTNCNEHIDASSVVDLSHNTQRSISGDEDRRRSLRIVLEAWNAIAAEQFSDMLIVIRDLSVLGTLTDWLCGREYGLKDEQLTKLRELTNLLTTAKEVADAMQELHRAGLMHGCLCPSAVYLVSACEDPRGFKAGLPFYFACKVTQPTDTVEGMNDGHVFDSDVHAFGYLLQQLCGAAQGACEPQWPKSTYPAIRQLGDMCMASSTAGRPDFVMIANHLATVLASVHQVQQQLSYELNQEAATHKALQLKKPGFRPRAASLDIQATTSKVAGSCWSEPNSQTRGSVPDWSWEGHSLGISRQQRRVASLGSIPQLRFPPDKHSSLSQTSISEMSEYPEGGDELNLVGNTCVTANSAGSLIDKSVLMERPDLKANFVTDANIGSHSTLRRRSLQHVRTPPLPPLQPNFDATRQTLNPPRELAQHASPVLAHTSSRHSPNCNSTTMYHTEDPQVTYQMRESTGQLILQPNILECVCDVTRDGALRDGNKGVAGVAELSSAWMGLRLMGSWAMGMFRRVGAADPLVDARVA